MEINPHIYIMEKNKIVQSVLILVIVVSVLVSGYILFGSNKPTVDQSAGGLAPMVDGKQVMTMTVYAAEYGPNYFKVKAGVPVRWEITSSGQPGCASGVVVSNILPGGSVYLNPNQGQVTVAEFTPQGLGTYKFSCSMNMVRGTIEVVN